MPHKAGDRVTTARRDALPLARRARSGARTTVSVPTVHDAAMRDLPRARDDARRDRPDAPGRLKAFGRRHESRSTGRATGARPPCGGSLTLSVPRPRHPASCTQTSERFMSLPHASNAESKHATSTGKPGVGPRWARLGRPGVACPAPWPSPGWRHMGDLTRVDPPRARRQCVGLSPSAYASGAPRRPGARTKAGTPHARRVLVAGAWASRSPATVSRPGPLRLATTTQHPPGHQWASPRETRSTVPPPRVTRPTRPGRDRGHGPCAGWLPVGQCPRGPHNTVSPTASAESTTHAAGVPTCLGRDAAPVGGNPRRREAAAPGPASLDRGRHPTDARKGGATPRLAAGSTVA